MADDGTMNTAPRRTRARTSPALISDDSGALNPAILFEFSWPVGEEPVDVVLVGTEATLRRMQRELDRAISVAIRRVRAEKIRARAERGGL